MRTRDVVLVTVVSLASACGGDGVRPAQVETDARIPDPADAGADAGPVRPPLPWAYEALPEVPHPEDNVPSEPKRQLGRFLFYDPLLSGDRATACVTCHSEIWGLGDQLPRSVGLEGKGAIGPGRVGEHMTRRNSPALWNAGYKERLFWDGHASSLEDQALRPLENVDELARDVDELVRDLRAIPAYVPLFQAAFPGEAEPITRENVARALATFVRAYVSTRAAYDQYLAGDMLALDDRQTRGMQLFHELACSSCHVPPRFESERYDDRHVAEIDGIADEGRFEFTGDEADRKRFRVPTLRNARETGPYFHNGTVASFEDAVRHEVDEQVKAGVRDALSSDEFDALFAFVRGGLTDTSREQHPPKSVPSGLTIPLDGDRLLRGGNE